MTDTLLRGLRIQGGVVSANRRGLTVNANHSLAVVWRFKTPVPILARVRVFAKNPIPGKIPGAEWL